jgi:ribonuclease-3
MDKEFEGRIGYSFKKEKLFTEAMSHASYVNEKKSGHCNERLEFLGDSILSLVVSRYLYLHHREMPEGQLSKTRAALVCEKSLFSFAKKIQLGEQLLLGKGEENSGGRERPALLADAFEALIAAIFLDSGFPDAEKFVLQFITENKNTSLRLDDYKTILQEVIQRNPEEKLIYVVASEDGPAHDRIYNIEVRLNSNTIGHGSARTKKEAEQQAAKEALELMGF